MSHRRLWVAATIIAAFVILSFLFSVPRAGDVALESEPQEQEIAPTPSVALHDAFKKGTHTITGSVEAPDACSIVTAKASLIGKAPNIEGIQVAISLSPDTGVCLELPTRADFSTTIVAPPDMPVRAMVNGISARMTPL